MVKYILAILLILPNIIVYGQTPNIEPRIRELASSSGEWFACNAGNGVACHRFVREVVNDANPSCDKAGWGLLTKNPGQQQCTLTECGPLDGRGYGEDVIVHGASGAVVDIVAGAGAPGARISWNVVYSGVGPKLPGNDWACLVANTDPPKPPDPPNPGGTDKEYFLKIIDELRVEIDELRREMEDRTDNNESRIENARDALDLLEQFTHERLQLNEKWIQELQARPIGLGGCEVRFIGIKGSCRLIP